MCDKDVTNIPIYLTTCKYPSASTLMMGGWRGRANVVTPLTEVQLLATSSDSNHSRERGWGRKQGDERKRGEVRRRVRETKRERERCENLIEVLFSSSVLLYLVLVVASIVDA